MAIGTAAQMLQQLVMQEAVELDGVDSEPTVAGRLAVWAL